MAQMHKRVKISIISLRLWEIKDLPESNIILQDCYTGHLAHFQYTSLSRLRKKFFHSTLVDSSLKLILNEERFSEVGLEPTARTLLWVHPVMRSKRRGRSQAQVDACGRGGGGSSSMWTFTQKIRIGVD